MIWSRIYEEREVSEVNNSGYPRVLLALIVEFESHRGKILNLLFCKKKREKVSTVESALYVGRRNSTLVDEGRKGCNFSRDKNERREP